MDEQPNDPANTNLGPHQTDTTPDVQPVVTPAADLADEPATPSPTISDVTPAPPAATPTLAPETPNPASPSGLKAIVLLLLAIVVLCAVAFIAYTYGKHQAKPAAMNTMNTPMIQTASVPHGATMVEQCVPGLGTQYVLPKDIPDGPIYNVNQGKVVAIEYMADLSQLSSMKNKMDTFGLNGLQYDHVNISPMAGHAGLTDAHYQIDFMLISQSQADKITCSSTSGSSGGMSGMAM